jgi:hypothetical protein
MRALWDCLSVAFVDRLGRPWVRWGAQDIVLNDAIYRDANFWRSFIKSRNVFPIHAVESIPFHIHIASDASMTGGGGVLDFKMSPEEIAVEWFDFEKQQHIN